MTNSKKPVLSVAYLLTTNAEQLQEFRDHSDTYLSNHGVKRGRPAYKIMMEVPRGGHQDPKDIRKIVGIILAETKSRDHGPKDLPDAPVPMPILRAFYEKFVEGKEIPWGPQRNIKDDLAAEIEGRQVIW
jgi:hypothetical protein